MEFKTTKMFYIKCVDLVFKRKKIQPHKYKKDPLACCEGRKQWSF